VTETLKKLAEIAEREFPDIVEFTEITHKLRIFIVDGSFVDVWLSERLNRYAYHWERRHIDGKIFRHDNIPHAKWKFVKTFPKHFHNGSEENVIESYISDNSEEAIREFLTFIRITLR
jgi:hypothetical protein